MIVDITGTILFPGNLGIDCLGNGRNSEIACCCDECDYMMCCLPAHDKTECLECEDQDCPRRRLIL